MKKTTAHRQRLSPLGSPNLATATIDKNFVKGLNSAYIKAVKGNKEQFQFKGYELPTPFAGHLLEFLNKKLIMKD